MKFIKSKLAKKLIIILIVLILFNTSFQPIASAYTLSDFADDVGGILFYPIKALFMGVLMNINGSISMLIKGLDGTKLDINNIKSEWFISPEKIFSGSIKFLNADLFNNESATGTTADNIIGVASKLYVLLRNICAFIMLAGLIFTGIRILTSSNIPTKKMQFLMLLEDWIIGMILLIFSHIIMILIFELSGMLVDVFKGAMPADGSLMYNITENSFTTASFFEQLTNLIMFGYLTWMVIVFLISYFKRFFWIVVLTIFAPVVSIMYAFGQQTKSIYSRWLREYIMTAMIQPFHMLVYYVLVQIPLGALGDANLFTGMYALVAISFIRPAEKYLRELFGFDKGIAGMGSYDSGVAPLKAVGKAAMMVGSIAADAVAPGSGQAIRTGLKAVDAAEQANAEGDSAEPMAEGEGAEGDAEENTQAMLHAARNNNSSAVGVGGGPGLGSPEELGNGDQPIGDAALHTGSGSNGMQDGINASNVTINASNIALNGQITEAPLASGRIGEGDSGNDSNSSPDASINNQDDQLDIGGGSEKKGLLRKAWGFMPHNVAISGLRAGRDIMAGKGSAVDALTAPYSLLAKTKPGKWVAKTGIGQKIGSIRDFAKRFEEAGGLAEIYKGFQGARDSMYVNGAPQDWKDTASTMDANIQKRREKSTRSFVDNANNMEFMLKGEGGPKILAKMQDQYSGKTPAYQLAMAKAEAKKNLEAMAKDYMPYGVTEVEIAFGLSEYAKKHSCLPEDAIRQVSYVGGKEIDFSKFNANQRNTSKVNVEYQLKGDYSVKSVSQAIPAASEYYSKGITNIENMMQADKIASKLSSELGNKLSAQMTRDIAAAVVKKGDIKYGGSDEKVRKMIEDITKKGSKK